MPDNESKPPATESFGVIVIDARYVDWPDVQFSEHAQRSNAQGLTIAERVYVAQRHARSDPFVSWWIELVNALVMDREEARDELTEAALKEQWVPCSERMPEHNVPVLAWGKTRGGYARAEVGRYDANIPLWMTSHILPEAWRPLPAPWEGGK